MVRKILGFVVGLVIANVIIIVSQMISGMIFGMPPTLDMNDTTAMANYISGLPTAAFALVAIGYALGYFVGGFAMRKVSQWDSLILPVILGALGTIGWIMNISMLPHPIWMVIVGFFCFIPFALIGHRAAKS